MLAAGSIYFSNLKGKHWDTIKGEYECSDCKDTKNDQWYPVGGSWVVSQGDESGLHINSKGMQYRKKTLNSTITDLMFSSANFNDTWAHANHIHIFGMQKANDYGASFSYEEDYEPSPEFMEFLRSLGFANSDFDFKGGKYKLSIGRLWNIFRPGEKQVPSEQWNIGIPVARYIIEWWRQNP